MRDYADLITWVIVADGEKPSFTEMSTSTRNRLSHIVSEVEIENPPTREQRTDKPGRARDHGAREKQHSAVEKAAWRRLEKDRFAKDCTAGLNKAALKHDFDRIAIFAPPHVLGEMRSEYHPELKKRIIAEAASDLTNHPVDDIEARVAKVLAPKPSSPPTV